MTASDPGQNEQREFRSYLMNPAGVLSESRLLEKSNIGSGDDSTPTFKFLFFSLLT